MAINPHHLPPTGLCIRSLLLLLLLPTLTAAQILGPRPETTGGSPVEIVSRGGTSFDGTIASAEGNVAVYTDSATLFADRIDYDMESGELFLDGNVRIYSVDGLFSGDRASYNTKTRSVKAGNFRAKAQQFQMRAQEGFTLGMQSFQGEQVIATTHDLSTPDYHLRAGRVRVYADDRVVMESASLWIGEVPVFWWPYLYQPIDESITFGLAGGYSDLWGAFGLIQYGFPIVGSLDGVFHLDPRSKRGVGVGLDLLLRPEDNPQNDGFLSFYYLRDHDQNLNLTSIPRVPINPDRYRIRYDQRFELTEQLYGRVRIDKLSDQYVLQDFFQSEFALNPQPENFAWLTYRSENFAANLLGAFQMNDFFQTVERLPEFAFESARTPWFGLPIFYEGATTTAFLTQAFAEGTTLIPNYDTLRIDSWHQLSYPGRFFGWLNLIPRVGVRGTYYEQTTLALQPFGHTGGKFKPVFNAGMEGSFKLTKVFEDVDYRALGLDGLRHTVQPYFDYSHVSNFGFAPPTRLLYDTLQPTTQSTLLQFPDFNAIDSIDSWDILRLGVRNRLQTRRDASTVNWLEVDTFFDVNFTNPYSLTDVSNLYNSIRFEPVPWAYVSIQSQIPLTNAGFTEINTDLNVMITPDLAVTLGHRYLDNNPFFQNSNLFRVGGYGRVNDHWAFSMLHQIEAEDGTLESQQYMVHRDMTSWVASIGAVIRDNRGVSEFGVMFTVTLKDFPQISLPFNFDPGTGQR